MKTRRQSRFPSRKAAQICRKAINLEQLEDRTLLTVMAVTNNQDSGTGSLRQAIMDANAAPGADVIRFDVGGLTKIELTSELPALSDKVTIDGTTASGYGQTPLIWLDGGGALATGLMVNGSDCQITALALTGFGEGIVLAGGGGHTVQSCVLGLDPTQTSQSNALSNYLYGIDVHSDNNSIGGHVAGQRNVISNSGLAGLIVTGNGTTIQGNRIGTDTTGEVDFGNGTAGIEVDNAQNTTIGGNPDAARNLISGNSTHGIELHGTTGVIVVGNYIGVDASGLQALKNDDKGIWVDSTGASSDISIDHNVISGNDGSGICMSSASGVTITGNLIGTDSSGNIGGGNFGNGGDGIHLETGSDENQIGGNTASERNVIVGSFANGVSVIDSSNNSITGNYIGLAADGHGSPALGNQQDGVHVEGSSSGNVIGGTAHGEGNVISGNLGYGIGLLAPSIVLGNLIGTSPDGSGVLGNGQDGIHIESDDNVIGGTAAGGNIVANSGDTGIMVLSGLHNAIRGNSVFDNTNLGIDLAEATGDFLDPYIYGPTCNDSAGHDGPNQFQNFPIVTQVTRSSGTVVLTGTLDANANAAYSIDLFASRMPDFTYFGEGELYLGSVDVVTDNAGHASFSVTYHGVSSVYTDFTATATDALGNTSEFSPAAEAPASGPAITSTGLMSSMNPSSFGQAVTFTATVLANGVQSYSGTVELHEGNAVLGSAAVDASGVATFVLSPSVGAHTYTAVYLGDGNTLTGSTSDDLVQQVQPAATTTILVSSVNPSAFGQSVMFTATVNSAAGTPSGDVTFFEGVTPLGHATLNSGGSTSITLAGLSVNSHLITAVYGGNGNFADSNGSTTQTVSPANTVTTVASSVTPSVFRQSVTFTANVSVVSPGAGALSGNVIFYDGSTAIGTASLVGGQATLTTAALDVGPHTITAAYQGDSNFNPSNSGPLNQVVNAASTTTTITSSANPSPYGQSVTFTATVAAIFPGAGVPDGTVTFSDGASVLGTVALSGGVATFTASGLNAGSHTITAAYSGSTSYNSSNQSLAQSITALATTTTLSGNPNPSTPGQLVTFTATVSGVNSNTGMPTGSVTFYDGSTAIGTGNLVNGIANFSTSSLSAGTHSITAVYSGDPNFTASSSAPFAQSVVAFASISGRVYVDANKNGLFDSGETPLNAVVLTLSGTNDLNQPVTLTATSDSTGAYRFDNLRPGSYSVSEAQPSGYSDGLDAKNNVVIANSNTTDVISGITVTAGQGASNNNFGELPLLTISGTVFVDMTGNGLTDDDTPQSGVLVNLYIDTDHSGTLTAADQIVDHTTTGSSGAYSFSRKPGLYFVQEAVPSGYLRTGPAVQSYYTINAPGGGDSSGNDFDNFLMDCRCCDVGSISYLINGTTIVNQLRGNIRQGDVVEAIFTIASNAAPHRYSLVSYTAPSAVFDASVANQQMISDQDTAIFGPGVHTLTVTVPDCFFQIDFVCGSVIDQLGPANSNIFYTPQGRLIDADNGGTQACINGPGSISGFTYVDINKNGLIDLNDGVIPGVKVTLTGSNDLGKSVTMVEFSDDDGQYFFGGLRPGTYTISETSPTGVQDGKDTLGTINGAPSSNWGVAGNDKFTGIKIGANQDGINYNFGENTQCVQLGQAATIGFWQNCNGQALIKSLNGGASATSLGIWLAATYPNLYGTGAGAANLLGKTNAQIAAFYSTLYKTTAQKIDAQVLAVALSTYVTDSGHAGNAGMNYGFVVNDTGLAVSTFNVGSNGAAFAVANNTTLTVGSLLDIANSRSWAGILWDVDHTGSISSTEQAWRNMANSVFAAINAAGDIT